MANLEQIKQNSAKLFKSKIQLINEELKNIGLEQLQFSLEEKYSRISVTFISSKGDNTVVDILDDIFNKKQEDVLTWLTNQFNNRYLYKTLHGHHYLLYQSRNF